MSESSQRSSTPFQKRNKAGSRSANTAIESHSKAAAYATLEAETDWVLENLIVVDATAILNASFGKLATAETKEAAEPLSDCFLKAKGTKEWKLEADMYEPLCLAFNKCCEGIKPNHDLDNYVPKHPLKCVDIHNKRYSLAPEMSFHTKIGPDLCLSFDSNTDDWLACDHPNILMEIKQSELTDIYYGTGAEASQARKELMRQLFGYVAYGQWPALPYRFCWSISISGHLMRIWRWTASGVVVTEPIKYLEDATVVAQFIRLVASGPYSRLGLDIGRGMTFSSIASREETVRTRRAISVYTDALPHNKAQARWLERAEECNVWRFQPSELPDASDYILVASHPISWTLGIFSRGTRCYIAIYQSDAKKEEDIEIANIHTLKVSWQYTTRTSELIFFDKVKQKSTHNYVPYLASVLCGGDVPHTMQTMGLFEKKDASDSTTVAQSNSPEINDEDLVKEYEPVNLNQSEVVASDPRVFRWIFFKEVGAPLSNFMNSKQMVQAICDAVEAHKSLHNMGILHRDISEGNVLIDLSNGNRGLLIDLDMSMDLEADLPEEPHEALRPAITGTLRFLSVAMKDQPMHRSWHDLESFFWLLVYMTLKHVPNARLHDNLAEASSAPGQAEMLKSVFPDNGSHADTFDALIQAKSHFLNSGNVKTPGETALNVVIAEFRLMFGRLHRALKQIIVFRSIWFKLQQVVSISGFERFEENPYSFDSIQDLQNYRDDSISAVAKFEGLTLSEDQEKKLLDAPLEDLQDVARELTAAVDNVVQFPTYENCLGILRKGLKRGDTWWMQNSAALEYQPPIEKATSAQSKLARTTSENTVSTRSMTFASSSASTPLMTIRELGDPNLPAAPLQPDMPSQTGKKTRGSKAPTQGGVASNSAPKASLSSIGVPGTSKVVPSKTRVGASRANRSNSSNPSTSKAAPRKASAPKATASNSSTPSTSTTSRPKRGANKASASTDE